MIITFNDSDINPVPNQLSNGGFEDGNLTGYTTDGSGNFYAHDTSEDIIDPYEGVYACKIVGNGYIERSLNYRVAQLSTFGIWKCGRYNFSPSSGTTTKFTITYSDASTTEITHETASDENQVWVYIDLLAECTAGKTITNLKIEDTGWAYWIYPYYIDYLVLSTGVAPLSILSWEEEQTCEPSVRDIPLRQSGAHIDEGTYILKSRSLDMSIRLSDINKTLLQALFDANAEITIICTEGAEVWTYVTWLDSFPKFYEYSQGSYNTVREWVAELRFKVKSVTFSGSAYSESEDTLIIDGNNFAHVLDASFSETNTIFEPELINQGTVEFDTGLWNRSPLGINYLIRMSSAGRWLLDQILIAHTKVNLTDEKYDINDYVWLKIIKITWNGNTNWSKPWEVELTMMLIPS